VRKMLEEKNDPLRGEVTIVIEGFEINEQELKNNIVREELTRPVNIIELARKMHETVEMSEKEFRDMLDDLFSLSNQEKNQIISIVKRKDKVTQTKTIINNFFK
jgi:hypothetical protein